MKPFFFVVFIAALPAVFDPDRGILVVDKEEEEALKDEDASK